MKASILVIDDEESIRFTFDKLLSREGYEISTAGNYDEALSRLDDKEFDLIFADIILGGSTGIHILQEVRKRNLGCPVIMITGYPNIENASEAMRLGAFDYIPKPVQYDTLIRVTAMALQHKALKDEKDRYRSNLEAIFRSVKDAIITIDRKLLVIEINESAMNICGLSRNTLWKPFTPDKNWCEGKCLEFFKKMTNEKRPVEKYRIECGRKKKPGQVVTISTFPLLDLNNTFSGAVMVVRDETRLADLERDLGAMRHKFHNIIGKSREMQKIYFLIEDLAALQTTVLISGESGTGKELVAEALHALGERSNKPLVKVNCSALSETLIESELFGHVKGAFTGAHKDRTGRFQKAEGGTIFLDEIGDISPKMQLKLLRVLQDMEIEKVGDSTPIKVNTRVVAATNQKLHEKVKKGEFREDLYYRLNVVEIVLPPLRERPDDVPLLLEHFLEKLRKKFNKTVIGISEDVLDIFMKYNWPGNIRELEHILEHAYILSKGTTITVNDLPKGFGGLYKNRQLSQDSGVYNDPQEIIKALEMTAWNKAKAARLLGISRQTIYRKLIEHKIREA
jgi:two-component system, NtrC family, response regulator HydG